MENDDKRKKYRHHKIKKNHKWLSEFGLYISVKRTIDEELLVEYYDKGDESIFQENKEQFLQVKRLSFTDQDFETGIPKFINNFFINIKMLYLSGVFVTSIEHLDKCKNLEYLDLSNNEIKKICGLESLIKLKHLDLSFNSISKLKNLDNLVNLRCLKLRGNSIVGLENIGKLTELIYLDVSGNIISQIDSSISNCLKLKTLKLGANKDMFPVTEEIASLPNLESLDLTNCAFEIYQLSNNVHVLRYFCVVNTVSKAITYFDSFHQLKELNLSSKYKTLGERILNHKKQQRNLAKNRKLEFSKVFYIQKIMPKEIVFYILQMV